MYFDTKYIMQDENVIDIRKCLRIIYFEIKKNGGIWLFLKKIVRFLRTNGTKNFYILLKRTFLKFSENEKKIDENKDEYCLNHLMMLKRSLRKKEKHYVKSRMENVSLKYKDLKMIAYYLPQYHPFKENDEWWGKGFSEWTNVTKAVPHFLGHYQPKLPSDLGFYDLRIIENQKAQIEIAKKYGIYGFCYYYYWFSGKKLMEKPLEQVLCNKELDFPFCICWANENWTRNWDGQKDQILIEQKYLPGYELEFIKGIEEILKDNRYIKIDKKPLIIIYAVFDLPDVKHLIKVWRNYCREVGIGEIFVAGVKRSLNNELLKEVLDALIEFPPHCVEKKSILKEKVILYPGYQGEIYDYKEIMKNVKKEIAKEDKESRIFHGIMPAWDNTARKPDGKGNLFADATPLEYEKWLYLLCEHIEDNHKTDEKMIFINAWNEWAEGAYLEPDRYWGYAYLEKTAQILEKMDCRRYIKEHKKHFTGQIIRKEKVAIILHLYFQDLWDDIAKYLQNMPEKFDLYVSLPEIFKIEVIERLIVAYPNVKLRIFENKGRDILPFLKIMEEIFPLNYEAVCKIHSKKSVHLDDGKGWKKENGNIWRTKILEELLGSNKKIEKILNAFMVNEKVGIIGPKGNLLSIYENLGGNKENLRYLCNKMDISTLSINEGKFFAGSMFWIRPKAMKSILGLGCKAEDFEQEEGQIDGTLSHAVERIVIIAADKDGYNSIESF